MAAASLHPASTAAADCGRGPQIHADCTHRDLLGFSRPSIQESRWSSSADQAFSHGARRGTTSPASPPSSRPSPHRRLTQCRTSGAALPPRRRVTGACAPMRVPPSTSPGRSPSAIATTTAAWCRCLNHSAAVCGGDVGRGEKGVAVRSSAERLSDIAGGAGDLGFGRVQRDTRAPLGGGRARSGVRGVPLELRGASPRDRSRLRRGAE